MVDRLGIPEVRDKLNDLAKTIRISGYFEWANEIEDLAEATFRKKPDKVARKKTKSLDHEKVLMIRHLRATTDMSQQAIANELGLNASGRVSEVLNGLRDDNGEWIK